MTRKGMRMKLSYEALKREISEHKGSFAVYLLLRGFVVLTLILQLLNGNFENVFLCLLTLLLLILPAAVQVEFHIELPTLLEVILLVFIFCAEILGEINAFYERIPLWDTLLHTVNGFVAAAIGFSLVDLMNRSERISFSLSPLFAVLVAFCVSMTIGVMWEFFEFFMDQVFQLDMQKDTVIQSFSTVVLDPSHGNTPIRLEDIRDVAVNGTSLGLGGYLDIGLLDTMEDLFVNFVGAFVFSIIGYFYVRSRGQNKFARRFIPTVLDAVEPAQKAPGPQPESLPANEPARPGEARGAANKKERDT